MKSLIAATVILGSWFAIGGLAIGFAKLDGKPVASVTSPAAGGEELPPWMDKAKQPKYQKR